MLDWQQDADLLDRFVGKPSGASVLASPSELRRLLLQGEVAAVRGHLRIHALSWTYVTRDLPGQRWLRQRR